LESVELYRRRHYLVAQLPDPQRRNRLSSWWRGVSGPLLAGFGLDAPPIPLREIEAAARQAEELRAQLRTVRLEVPEPGEIRWLYARAVRRGLVDEPPLAGWPDPRLRYVPHGNDLAVTSPSLAPLVEANFRNGGTREDEDRPWHRRYLRVETDSGVSYQTFAVVADAPQQFAFPGGLSEWLMVADQLPFPVDWAARIRAVPNQTAARSAIRHQRELAGQVAEYESEPAGPPPSLAAAMDAIDDERAQLAANPSEPELHVAMVYAVWADNLPELEQRVGWLQTLYRASEYHLPAPTGGQLDLFEALLPGSGTPRVCQDYRQYLLPRDLAAGMPFAGVGLGDPAGMLLGASRDAGCARPVLMDPAAGPRNDRDGSVAAFGALGSGKSYLAKRLAAAVLLRGGQMLLIDRTQAGEYVRFAKAMSDVGVTTQVVTIGTDDGLLLDPLRTFDGPDAAQAAVGYLGMVCGADPTSLEAATLTRAVRQVHDDGGRLVDVLGVLDALAKKGSEYRHARELSLRLAAIRENRYGAPAWGTTGASVRTDVDCTVIHLPNLAIPSRDVLLSEHLSRKLLAEQICSLGLLYLTTALARHVAYAHPDRFAALCLDEAWALTSTLPGQQLLLDVLRDGRKHNAAGWVFSQHPDDLTPDLRDLVSTRFVFGLSGDAAAAGLAWVGVDPSRPNVDLLESWAARREPDQRGNSGGRPPECLLRDASARIGHIQIAEAEIEAFRVGFESNPTRIPAPAQPTERREITAESTVGPA
jgi:AAA-like domain